MRTSSMDLGGFTREHSDASHVEGGGSGDPQLRTIMSCASSESHVSMEGLGAEVAQQPSKLKTPQDLAQMVAFINTPKSSPQTPLKTPRAQVAFGSRPKSAVSHDNSNESNISALG
eukprot:CAMPEP_0206269560 /NCGR_PEP_ID=MMETSP0047_2-20121206/32366_1 /ASSEMBLY_ACC=CAM_ASM_000192 /TAXON_ID=195065 /ORGANISM="Chroomonas mesostigmatica_cf, Strain CCMP1168" /LENGTH=115 /DNA_ID=CAMNT_0053698075 /DNA_START=141 /DNA_END=485 /DNA_ORIENTATION=+